MSHLRWMKLLNYCKLVQFGSWLQFDLKSDLIYFNNILDKIHI